MKKWLLAILALTVVVGLVACDKQLEGEWFLLQSIRNCLMKNITFMVADIGADGLPVKKY